MPKPTDDVQDLKRRLALLARLDGRALACAEGLAVFATSEPMRVRDARPLARACEAGPPPLAAVTASIETPSPPTLLERGLLAAARRDLRVVASRTARALVREAPRSFRRYGDIDDAWIAHKETVLARLSEQLRATGEDGGGAWLPRAIDAIRLAYGDGAAVAVAEAIDVFGKGGARARAGAERFFALWALAFEPRPRAGGPIALSAKDVERAAAAKTLIARFSGLRITLDEVLALHALDLRDKALAVAKLIETGLPIDEVKRLASLGHAADLAQLQDAETASAYASFLGTLLPHYRSLGLDVPLTPEVFERLHKTTRKREDMAVLAVCLMKHHASTSPWAAENAIARLDATLGLFQRRPAEAASILAELSGTSPGAGREAFPDFAAWLGDSAMLDRYVHLARLAGAPVALSNALRADFERAARLEGERAHLASLPSRTAEQDERLRRLTDGEVATADPSKTRRKLQDRIDELQAAAYEKRVDDVFRRILKDVWSISLPKLTPAWREAIRFYLAVDKNQELLGTVLRAAASGTDLARSLPKNRAWIEEARSKLDVEAWLAPRAHEVTLGERAHRLAVEEDPVEVLRMGIPFDTCLSLDGGVNAASTVVNAADANKRVIYLRDPDGDIVARKLVAVSEQGALVGYRLYVAGTDHKDAIVTAVRTFCEELAAAARLPLASAGKPRQIHPGFWYDDGTVHFGEEPEAREEPASAPVKAYCRSLGLTAPARAPADLHRRARVWGALRRGDLDEVLAALPREQRMAGVGDRAAVWCVAQLDRERLAHEARTSWPIRDAWMRRAADQGAGPLLEVALKHTDCYRFAEEAVLELHRFPRTAEVAAALVEAAVSPRGREDHPSGYGLDHQVLYSLPWFARVLPVATSFALCDRVAPLLRWVYDTEPDCRPCVEIGESRLLDAIEAAYALGRDPETVTRRLGSARSTLLGARAALRIAARYALAPGAATPSLPPPCPQPIHPSPAALRALAKLRARSPELDADPDMLAAVLRQAAIAHPRGLNLPVPAKAPFEALGDLHVQLDLAEVLAPWSGAEDTQEMWKPGPWELHHHRRHTTARRAAFVAEARRAMPAAPALCDALARLGDTAALEALLAEQPKQRGKGGPTRMLSRALQRAREAAAQWQAVCAADPMEATAGLGAGALESAALEPALVAAAFARIERAFGDPSANPAHALRIARAASLPWNVSQLVAERLVARGPLGEEALAFVKHHLRERTPHFMPHVVPELARAFIGIPEVERDLGAALAKVDESVTSTAVRAADAATGGRATATGFFEVWMGEVLQTRGNRAVANLGDGELFVRAVRTVLATRAAPGVISFYRNLEGPEQRSILLGELSKHPLRTAPAMREAFDQITAREHWREDPESAIFAGWLAACLDAPAPG